MSENQTDIRFIFVYNDRMAQNDRHRVSMYFQDRSGWQCQFLEADLKTSLPRKLRFTSADKVIELVRRSGGLAD